MVPGVKQSLSPANKGFSLSPTFASGVLSLALCNIPLLSATAFSFFFFFSKTYNTLKYSECLQHG